jgi:hypothetical protein
MSIVEFGNDIANKIKDNQTNSIANNTQSTPLNIA